MEPTTVAQTDNSTSASGEQLELFSDADLATS